MLGKNIYICKGGKSVAAGVQGEEQRTQDHENYAAMHWQDNFSLRG